MCSDANDLVFIANSIVNILGRQLCDEEIFLLVVLLENIASQLKRKIEVDILLQKLNASKCRELKNGINPNE